MDVIAMHTAGFEETVATLGTALTGKHVSQMIKLTDRILLFLDSDEAGLNAALRVGDIFSTFEHEPYVVTLGQVAKDPDEFIQRFGSELLEQKIDSAGSYMDFLLSQLPKKLDLETFGGKTRAIKQYLTPLLSGGTPLKRSDYARKVSEFLQITIPDLRRLVMENRNQNRTTPQNNQEKTIKRPQMSPVIRDLIASLILKPNLIPEYQKAVSEVGELVTNQRILDLLKEIISSGEKGSMDDIQLQIRENPLYHEITAALMESGESAVELFRGSLVKLREIKINRELSEIEKKMKTLEISGEIDTLTGLQKRFIELSRLRSML
jgi:DNA primase